MAPLTASLLTSVALGVGVAIARNAAERRTARRRRDRQLGLRPGESLGTGLHRMVLAQADLAIEQLAGDERGVLSDEAVHETRKALKRLRALLRLLEGQLEDPELARERELLRKTAARLAGARDAEVMRDTLDGLCKRHAKELSGRYDVLALRRRLALDYERVARRTIGDPAVRMAALADLGAFRRRAAAWELPEEAGLELIEGGLRGIYRQGRRRFRRVRRGKGDQIRAMHAWRKRVKDLRYAAETLERSDLRSRRARAGNKKRRARARREAAWLHRLAVRADELGETLGEDHDLAVLAILIRREDAGGAGLRRSSRKRLLTLIEARRRKLRRRALRDGERLYGRRPGSLLARIGRAYEVSDRAVR